MVDENWVKTKYGIMPEQFIHLQALTGDKSDNSTYRTYFIRVF